MRGGILVWASIANSGRCRFCRLAIIWRQTNRGKALPFNGQIPPLHITDPDERGRRFELLSPDDLHLRTCRFRKQQQLAQAPRRTEVRV